MVTPVEINALSGDLAQMDLENVDALKEIIERVLDLKLISGNYFKGQHTPYLDGNKWK